MRYYVYVDDGGTATWAPGNLNELFRNPRSTLRLMNSTITAESERKRTDLGNGRSWELVRGAEPEHGIISVIDENGSRLKPTALEPDTLYEVLPGGISTRKRIRRGKNGFEPIDPSAEPVRSTRPRPLAEVA